MTMSEVGSICRSYRQSLLRASRAADSDKDDDAEEQAEEEGRGATAEARYVTVFLLIFAAECRVKRIEVEDGCFVNFVVAEKRLHPFFCFLQVQ